MKRLVEKGHVDHTEERGWYQFLPQSQSLFSSSPVQTMEPSRKRTGGGSILAYFNKRSRTKLLPFVSIHSFIQALISLQKITVEIIHWKVTGYFSHG